MNTITPHVIEALRKVLPVYAQATLYVSIPDLQAYAASRPADPSVPTAAQPYDPSSGVTGDPTSSLRLRTEAGDIVVCYDPALTAGKYRLEFTLP